MALNSLALRLSLLPLAALLPWVNSLAQDTSANERALVSAGDGEILSAVKLPPEYAATIFAQPPEVNYPTFVKPTPDGPVFVAVDKNSSLDEEPGRGRVVACFDDDRDGVADRFTQFIPDIDSPRGMEWDGEWLYVMHTPKLSAFRDTDGDGVADDSRTLIKGIGFDLSKRPADHTSNGVTLGIDGWLYLAIGDFGFMNARGTDGRTAQLRGGGVVRVKTDGSDLEIFSRGTRNIYEVAIDPLLNAFARDNTNDGGGWDVRLHHFTGLEHHGYPSLYMNFKDEIVPPLADYGGGAGTGAHFLFEPAFPRGDANRLYTVDWGRSGIFQHRLQRKGATFEEVDSELFMTVDRVTDMAVDGVSNLYVSSWAGGRYRYGGEDVGYVLRVTPKNNDASGFPEIATLSATELVELLAATSATKQLMAQRELLRRENIDPAPIAALAKDHEQTPETRVAALFTLAQIPRFNALPALTSLASDPKIGHLSIRAIGNDPDNDDSRAKVALRKALKSELPRHQLEAIVVVARQQRLALAKFLVPLSNDSDSLIAHTAINALAQMRANKVCLAALDSSTIAPTGPLKALAKMHDEAVVRSLLKRLDTDMPSSQRSKILNALARLAYKEGEWEGGSWGTRPDTRGPYFDPEPWAATETILDTVNRSLTAPETDQLALLETMAMNRLIGVEQLPAIRALAEKNPQLELPYLKAIRDLGSPSAEATAFIARIAASPERSLETRAYAAYALLSQNDSDAARLGFQTFKQVAIRAQSPHEERLVQDAAMAFLKNERLPLWVDWLLQETNTQSDRASQIAWTALLRIRYSPDVDASVKEDVGAAIQSTRGSQERRIPLLDAIANHQIREASELVVESSASEVRKIRDSAREAADALGIELGESKQSEPTIAEMTREHAIEEIRSTSGDPQLGEALFARQTCILCHTAKPDETLKGPYLGNIASIFNRQELAIAIMDPSDSIAQGFVTNVITLRDGSIVSGFVSFESSDVVELRDITGNARRVATEEIEARDHLPTSMMPPGLVSNLSVREFASLLAYLEKLDEQN